MRLALREVAAGRPAATAAAAPPSTATVTVAAVPDIPPDGVPIDTITDAGVSLGRPLGRSYAADPGSALQLVILDRQDLSLVEQISFGGDASEMADLVEYVNEFDDGNLAIIATPPNATTAIDSGAALADLNDAIKWIGGTAVDEGTTGFSAIGVPGLRPGNGGTQNFGLTVDGQPGNLNGFLRADSSGNYAYVDADYVPFDTAAPGTGPTQAVISVGENSYSSNVAPGQAGFYVLVLDAGTLAKKFDATWLVSGPDIEPAFLPPILTEMHQALQGYVDDPSALVFIQSVGTIQRDGADAGAVAEWNQVRDDQTALGGHGYYLNAADGGSYAFVGPADAPTYLSPWAMTASADATGSAGQLSGLLGRNPQSQFYPKIAGTQSAVDIGLPQVASAEPVPWPHRDSEHQDALACVASKMGLTMPIEDHYYENTSIQWGQFAGTLQGMSADNCPGDIAAQDFQDVKDQLAREWLYVPTIQNGLIPNLQTPLLSDQGGTQLIFSDAVQAVQNALTPPDSSVGGNGAQIAIDVLWIASYIPDLGDAAGLTAGIMQLALDSANNSDGSPTVTDFHKAASGLADEIVGDYQAVYDQFAAIGDVLVSDWGRLSTAGQNAEDAWSWDRATDTPQARDALNTATKKLAFETLFPAVYTTYRFGDQEPSDARSYVCNGDVLPPIRVVPTYQPFANEPEGGNLVVVGAGPQTDLWAYGRVDQQFLLPYPDRTTNGTPPQQLWNDMFANPSAPNVPAPPLPSQLRFDLDAYVDRPVITHDQNPEQYGICLVNGEVPQQAGG